MKQAIKLEFRLKRYASAVEHYQELLTYVKSSVISRNYSEKSINNMLDFIEKSAEDGSGRECMETFYSKTLESFQSTNNERLWLKTNIKLARLWFDQKKFTPLTEKLHELHQACQKEDGTDDPNKGTYSLEIYALEILMYAEMKNNKRLKLLYQRALRVRSAVPHPQILGVIREAGGKMHMSEENWKDAQSDFFESFRNYDEAGSLQRIQVLNYLVLCTMLMGSNINPFDTPETKAYQNDPRISAMTAMVDAYQRQDIDQYESILKKNPEMMQDPFIAENIAEVTRAIRTNSVLKIVAPYSRFSFDFIAKKLRISNAEVQDIIGFLILDGKLQAQIDQTKGTVEKKIESDVQRVQAVDQWTKAVESLWSAILRSTDSNRSEEGGPLPSMQTMPTGPPPAYSEGTSSKRKGKGAPGKRALYTGS